MTAELEAEQNSAQKWEVNNQSLSVTVKHTPQRNANAWDYVISKRNAQLRVDTVKSTVYYHAAFMQAVLAMSQMYVRPSVCLSHAWTVIHFLPYERSIILVFRKKNG